MKNGSFNITSSATYDTNGEATPTAINADTKVLFKANSTYYWFAQEGGTDINGDTFVAGALITHDTKVKKSDIGYSTNLVKTGVAVKVANAKPNQT